MGPQGPRTEELMDTRQERVLEMARAYVRALNGGGDYLGAYNDMVTHIRGEFGDDPITLAVELASVYAAWAMDKQ